MSVTPTSVSVSATTNDPAPTFTVQVTVANPPRQTLYLAARYSMTGVSGVTFAAGVFPSAGLQIAFKIPAVLGAGTYADSLLVTVCLDQNCVTEVGGSPIRVPISYTVTAANPQTATPLLNSLSPASASAGGAGFTLSATGYNFSADSVLLWNGSSRPTTYVSSSQVTAQITGSDIAAPQTVNVSVSNQSGGGGVSLPVSFQVLVPAPATSSISPTQINAGSAQFTLTVNGSGFLYDSTVQWNGTGLVTTFVSSTQLTASVPAADVANPGSATVTVSNALSGGIASGGATFTIGVAPLTLSAISPTSVAVGNPALTLTVLGTGFNSSSLVDWNGAALATTYVSTTELLAQVPSTDVAAAASASVTVVNAGSPPVTSNADSLSIVALSIDATAYQINPQHTGAITFQSMTLPSASLWSVNLGGAPSYAIIAAGKVFVTVPTPNGYGAQLFALDQATGSTVWGPVSTSEPVNAAFDGGTLFVLRGGAGTSGLLEALDPATGAMKWSTLLTSQYSFSSAPTAANGMVFVSAAGTGGTIYAVDQASGALIWTQTVENGDDSAPSVTADGVYVDYPCQVYDLRPLTGEIAWRYNGPCEGGGGANTVVANGVLYAPSLIQPGPATFNGTTFDAETGTMLGTLVADNPPAFGSQMGYFLQTGTLRGISLASSSVVWSFAGDGTLVSPPILVNGTVFVGSSSGLVYGVDAATGAQVWRQSVGAPVPGGGAAYSMMPLSGLSAGDGLLVVPAGNTLTAFRLSPNP